MEEKNRIRNGDGKSVSIVGTAGKAHPKLLIGIGGSGASIVRQLKEDVQKKTESDGQKPRKTEE